MADIIRGVLDVKVGGEDFYSCSQCGKTFRISAIERRGGDIQASLTRLCDCMKVEVVRVCLVAKEAQADGSIPKT